MSYRVEEDERAQAQVEALPAAALTSYAEIHGCSRSHYGPRRLDQPQGTVTYLVLEDIRRVDVLDEIWLG